VGDETAKQTLRKLVKIRVQPIRIPSKRPIEIYIHNCLSYKSNACLVRKTPKTSIMKVYAIEILFKSTFYQLPCTPEATNLNKDLNILRRNYTILR
jgi:hypothetical protein